MSKRSSRIAGSVSSTRLRGADAGDRCSAMSFSRWPYLAMVKKSIKAAPKYSKSA